MRKLLAGILGLAVQLSAFPTGALALTSGNLEEMFFGDIPPVIVASGKEESVKDAPAHVYSITGEEMLNRGYRTLIDLLPDLPSTNVAELVSDPSDYSQGQGATNIRGVQGGLKLLIDGVEMDPQHGYANTWAQNIPIQGVERVEFIMGPYASLYGRNTASGILNVVLKSGDKVNGAQLSGLYGSYNQVQGTLVMGKRLGGWDLYGSAFRNESDGRDLAKEYPEIYGFDARNTHDYYNGTGYTKAIFRPGVSTKYIEPWSHRDFYLRVRHDGGTEFNVQYNRLEEPNINSRFNPLNYVANEDSTDDKPTFNIRLKQAYGGDVIQAETAVQYQEWARKAKNAYIDPLSGSVLPGQGEALKYILVRAHTIGARQSVRYKGESNETLFKVGYDAVREPIKASTFKFRGPLGEEHNRVFLNLTLQQETRWTDNFKTVFGVMNERGNVGSPVWVPRASVIYSPTLADTVKVLYGKGYRTPGTELLVDQATTSGITKGADKLDPTWIESFDTQWIHQASERTNTSVSAFYAIQENFVLRKLVKPTPPAIPTSIISYIVNVPDGQKRSYGFETEVNTALTDRIKAFLSYSYIDGDAHTQSATGVPMVQDGVLYTAHNQVKTGVNVLLAEKKLNFYVHNIYRSSSGDWYNNPRIGGYNVLDLNLRTTDAMSARWSVSAGVKNVLNRKGFLASPDGTTAAFIPSAIRRRYWTVETTVKF